MSKKIFHTVFTYVNWVIANYHAISKINSIVPVLKLVSPQWDRKTGDVQFVVQVSGKNLFPKLSMLDFVQDPLLLDRFSKADQAVIGRFLSKYISSDIYRIAARTYDREKKRFILTIELINQQSNEMKCINVKNIASLSKQIHLFDSEDAFLIGLETSADLRERNSTYCRG